MLRPPPPSLRPHNFPLCHDLAQARINFGSMVTYYCISLEEALRRAKKAGKKPGCYYGGITLPSGRRGFAIYRNGKEIERYTSSGPVSPPARTAR